MSAAQHGRPDHERIGALAAISESLDALTRTCGALSGVGAAVKLAERSACWA